MSQNMVVISEISVCSEELHLCTYIWWIRIQSKDAEELDHINLDFLQNFASPSPPKLKKKVDSTPFITTTYSSILSTMYTLVSGTFHPTNYFLLSPQASFHIWPRWMVAFLLPCRRLKGVIVRLLLLHSLLFFLNYYFTCKFYMIKISCRPFKLLVVETVRGSKN